MSDLIETVSRSSASIDDYLGAMQARHERLMTAAVERGAQYYKRERCLPELLRCTPEQIADKSKTGTEAILERLHKALTATTNALARGHWSASGSRALAIRQAIAGEQLQLAERELTRARFKAALELEVA